ncbi:mismatch-specific DNA-glycosylase [Parafrankia colletiae]|uniref:Mismatch-specific DNA-glycosylase n=1 Tax=Parafrankia colletiae TaxID=573497 RepID=A0A1S1QYZ5_9ACTN|nr:G/U mismatch-specific DNA glycosylase [Parafrankia colletiae]MCK9899416.1 G/U mismatch-specific DNA glycosylase [Frankia sp. Cpl3]OHV38836.1 mismatch-specific DNA-glycosylase [Parafrankia colletiae]
MVEKDVSVSSSPQPSPPAAARPVVAARSGSDLRDARDARGRPTRPGRAELLAAYGTTVPDLVGSETRVLLCGINPSLESGATGFHFGTPSNRLWPVLHLAGFTSRRLHPSETDELRARGIGITNLVHRATARADEIDDDEVRAGVPVLTTLVERIRPDWVAFLGLAAYRIGFGRRTAKVGRQPERLGPAGVWLLPNPSGLNAHYQLPDLVRVYGELHEAAYGPGTRSSSGGTGSDVSAPPEAT